jgi:hypothetical protein
MKREQKDLPTGQELIPCYYTAQNDNANEKIDESEDYSAGENDNQKTDVANEVGITDQTNGSFRQSGDKKVQLSLSANTMRACGAVPSVRSLHTLPNMTVNTINISNGRMRAQATSMTVCL